jgi:glycogen debranching enzyme
MSSHDSGYSPIAHHNGTVWPHDTGLIAEGMRRYGYCDQAGALILALLDAATYFDHLLPEVFAGYPRAETSNPIEYPTACRPQAWAAGAPLLGLRHSWAWTSRTPHWPRSPTSRPSSASSSSTATLYAATTWALVNRAADPAVEAVKSQPVVAP